MIERSRRIWTFSHLTFQEYFVARQMQKTHDTEPFQELVKHIANRYWKEVFLLTAEALANADNLLNVMKVKVNQIVAGDEKIQQFLVWVNEKSFSVSTSYKPAAVRDFYFSGCPLFLNEAIDPRGKASHTDGLDCVDMIENMDDDLDLCIDANLSYALEMSEIYASQSDPSFSFDLAINSAMQLTDDTDLYYELYDLYDQFPDDSWDDPGALHRWWQINGQAWSKQLQTVMIEYRNLGHTWQFLSEQKHLLQRYRIANEILVDCLSNCEDSRTLIQQEIEQMLLLPIAEIERRKEMKSGDFQ